MKQVIVMSIAGIVLFCAGLFTGRSLYGPESSYALSTAHSPSSKSNEARLSVSPSNPFSQQLQELVSESASTVEDKTQLTATVYRKLAQEDPVGALASAATLPDGLARNTAILDIIDEWASKDSLAAFNWFTENADSMPQLSSAYATIMGHHIQQDPHSAGGLIQDMQASELKTSLAGQLASIMAENDPQRSIKWAESLSDPASRLQALETSLQAYASKDVSAAFEYSLKQGNPALRDQLLNQVGLIMARTNPQQTATDIDNFPKSVRPQVIEHIASSWSATAPQATREWISEMPLGPIRDQAIERATHNLTVSDQASSFDLAASVNDSAKRYGLIRDVILQWNRTDPEATQNALANADRLTQEQKDSLTKDLEENGSVLDLVVPAQ